MYIYKYIYLITTSTYVTLYFILSNSTVDSSGQLGATVRGEALRSEISKSNNIAVFVIS